MTYLQVRKRPGEKKMRIVYAAALVIVVLAIGVHLIFPHLIPSMFTSLFKPFWIARVSLQSGSLDSRDALLAQNELLRQTLEEYEVRIRTVRAVEEENESLKSALGRSVFSAPETVISSTTSTSTESILESLRERVEGMTMAVVLVRPPASAYDEILIDIGTEQGVKVNDKVYGLGDVLIGRVVDTMRNTSKVMLYSSPNEKYEVSIGEGNEIVTATGRGGGQYEAVVSRSSSVKDGDFVRSPSLHDKPFGIVTAVISDPAEPFETVLFASPVSMYSLRWVLVETSQ